MFHFDNYSKLIEVMGAKVKDKTADSDGISLVKNAVASFIHYVKTVDEGETAKRIAYACSEGAELRASVETIENTRHTAHEAAIANVSILNRIAAMYGVEPIFTGDVTNRLVIAAFCLEVTTQIFQNRSL